MKWIDLPQPMNCFTARSAMMMDLKKRTSVQQYSANTKIVVVQKCILPEGTFYRTETAKKRDLDWAFRASAFGLPDEKAPSVHLPDPNKLSRSTPRTPRSTTENKKQRQTMVLPKDGETRPQGGLLKRLLRRING